MTSKAYLILNRSVEKNIENIFNSHQIRFRRKKDFIWYNSRVICHHINGFIHDWHI